MNELITSTLSSVCTLVTDGTHDTPKTLPEGIPFIKAKQIANGYIDFDDCEYISHKDHLKVISRSKPEQGDTLFAHIGATLGATAYINTDIEFSIKNIALFKPNPEKIYPRYLYYVVLSDVFQHVIKNYRTGAAQPFVSLEILRNQAFTYHKDIDVQRKIADVLSAYDDLIEVNTHRIRILEQMAQSVYHEWFGKVDEKSLPEGWEEIEVKQIIERLPKGRVYEKADVVEKGEIIVIDQSRDEYLGYHNNEPDFIAHPSNPIAIFGDHTCKMQLMVRPFSIGPNVVPFTSKQGYPIHYVFSVVDGLVETKEYKRHWNDLVGKKIALPPIKLANSYSEKIEPFLAQKDLLTRKNANLRRTRGLLLPRLVSGEIEVNGL